MARPRTFDTDTAVADAMDVFWALGYGEATLPDLLEGMNLTRGSLYKAFTDKKTLFLQVLERYDQKEVASAVEILTTPGKSGRCRIALAFNDIVTSVEGGDRRGCLLCSAAAGPATFDPEIKTAVARSMQRMQLGFRTALQDTDKAAHAEDLSHFLVHQYVGGWIMARSGAPLETLRQACAAMERHF